MNLASYDMFRTPLQFQKHIAIATNVILAIFKSVCPVAEINGGTLQSGIRPIIIIGKDDVITLRINIGENVVYAGATQEEWVNRSGTNPNQGWIDRAYALSIDFLTSFIKDPTETMVGLHEVVKKNMKEFKLENIEVVDE